jgi:hypothetical protein
MSICTHDNALWIETLPTERNAVAVDVSRSSQRDRIMKALGLTGGFLPRVDEDSLSRYYEFLSANLSFPFAAYYPHPTNAREQSEFRCYVLELLDPTIHLGDEFDGIFCKTRKGKYELNLPLIELELPQGSPNCELIEDFWYWFWNWR